jgi:hypothetical protein
MNQDKALQKSQIRAEKEAKAAAKRADKAAKREAAAAKQAADKAQELETYGREVLSEMFSTHQVKIYDKGFVKVGFFSQFEKLVSIQASMDSLQKKTGPGRAVSFVFTGGLSSLGPNKRGDLLLTIVTDKTVHSLSTDVPYEHDMKSLKKIEQAGLAVLKALDHEGPVAAAAEGLGEALEKLVTLHKSGSLTDEEFSQAKAKLLNQ